MVNHHPTPELLASFSAGSLQLSYALCVSAHLEHCADCRTNVNRLKSLGADMFNNQKVAAVSDDFKSRIFDQLDNSVQAKADEPQMVKPDLSAVDNGVPRCLRKLVPESYDKLDWNSVAPAIKSAALCSDGERTQVSMMKLMPGARVGHHRHLGEEITLVLEGSFSDEEGIYQKGDFILRDSKHKHKPVASKDGPCICLTVQDAPIQFTGFLARLFNPLMRRSYGI